MSSCGSPPSGSACARRRCAARGRRGGRRPPRRTSRTRPVPRRPSSSSWRRTRRSPSAWPRAASSPSSSTPNGAGPPRRWRAARKRTAWPSCSPCPAACATGWRAACSRSGRTQPRTATARSPTVSPRSAAEASAAKRPGITVPRPGRAPEPGALPVEVDDEEIDDAELTAAEDGDGPAAAESVEESVEEGEGLPRPADPVRVYLREAASIQLLTREGEVEIAKRIEQGEHLLVRAALGTSHALRYVLALAERLRAGEVRVRDLVRDEGEEDAEAEPGD